MRKLTLGGKGRKATYRAVDCYGILQPDGRLWMGENCVCREADVLESEVLSEANDEVNGKCRVVKLYVRATR